MMIKSLSILLFLAGGALMCSAGAEDRGRVVPGAVWHDTDGSVIQAHGGGILKRGKTYYWYGENRSHGYFNKIGVSCYSSTDLFRWKNLGVALPKDALPEAFRDGGVCERPKVIYNPKTRCYVMWMHLDTPGYGTSEAGVATAVRPEGPFTLHSRFRPVPSSTFRDMNLFVDDDGKAYVFYAGEGNPTMHVARLDDSFTAPESPMVEGKTWSRIFVGASREAPAPFKHKGKYYIITSGCTGWKPNRAQYAVADAVLGPWTVKGDPCAGYEADTTFRSQSTFVLPAPGKPDGRYIYMGDRWNPDNLADSRYIWLPFRVADDGAITLLWHDAWDMTTFDRQSAEG